MAVKYTQTFKTYEDAAAEARRAQAMADMLQQQAYQPIQMDTAGPVSYTQGLAKILQSYLAGKEGRKAREAETESKRLGREEFKDYISAFEPERATTPVEMAMAPRSLQQRMELKPQNLDLGQIAQGMGTPTISEQGAMGYTPPTGKLPSAEPMEFTTGTLTSAQRRAKILEGMGSGNPMVQAIAQAEYAKKPEVEKFGQTSQYDQSGRAYVLGEGGSIRYLPGITKDKGPRTITKEVDLGNKVLVQYSDGTVEEKAKGLAPSAEPKQLYTVNVNGVDTYVPYSQAIGKTVAKKSGAEPSEAENQATYLTNRVLNAQRQINQVIANAPEALRPGKMETAVLLTPGVRGAAGAVQSPERQIVSAAQSDMLDALLTLATGISYTEEQKEANKKSYLPSITENDQVAAAKYDRLLGVVAGAKARAGRAWTPEMDKSMQDVLINPFKKEQAATPQGGLSPAEKAELDALRVKRGGRN